MPDLVSKLRELIAKVPHSFACPLNREVQHYGPFQLGASQQYCTRCQIESLLGLEGQAAAQKWCAKYGGLYDGDYCVMCTCELKRPSTCGPSQPELSPEERHASGLEWAKDNPADAADLIENLPNILPSPSTPIVPSTAGLSEISIVKAILSAYQTAYAKFHDDEGRDAIESDGMAIGYASVELAKLLAGREAQIRKSVLEEAAQVIEKDCDMWKPQNLDKPIWSWKDMAANHRSMSSAIRALAERPAPAGEVKGKKS